MFARKDQLFEDHLGRIGKDIPGYYSVWRADRVNDPKRRGAD